MINQIQNDLMKRNLICFFVMFYPAQSNQFIQSLFCTRKRHIGKERLSGDPHIAKQRKALHQFQLNIRKSGQIKQSFQMLLHFLVLHFSVFSMFH